MFIYYVYAYLRENGTPYYIGKGKDNRAYVRGKHERIKRPKDKSRIIFLAANLPESTAYEVEKFMILFYGRKNNDQNPGILQNYTDGGEGVCGSIRTQEWNENISKANKGKPKPPRSKIHNQKIADSIDPDIIRNIRINAPRFECKYCNGMFQANMLKRWHNENCKKYACT